MIVPEEDLIHGKLWVLSTADESQDIASEKHFHNTYAAIKLYENESIDDLTSLERVFEGKRVEYFEAFLCTACEAPLVLVESDVEDILLPGSCH
jgi:hypothetical protein